jgi:hypothetical protein
METPSCCFLISFSFIYIFISFIHSFIHPFIPLFIHSNVYYLVITIIDGMSAKDLKLFWSSKPYKKSVVVADGVTISQFALDEYTAEKTIANYTTGIHMVVCLSVVCTSIRLFLRPSAFINVSVFLPLVSISV